MTFTSERTKKVQLIWLDPAIEEEENPIVARFERSQLFDTIPKAVIHARHMLRRRECWADYLEINIWRETTRENEASLKDYFQYGEIIPNGIIRWSHREGNARSRLPGLALQRYKKYVFR